MPDNILHIPIQINGDGTNRPTNLLDRELYVLDNGTLYVGKRNNATGSIDVMEVVGRVIPNATITNPTIEGSLILGDGMVVPEAEFDKNPNLYKQNNRLLFIDEGSGV